MVDAQEAVKILADLLAKKAPDGYTQEELEFRDQLKAEQAKLPQGTCFLLPNDPEFCDF